MGTITLHMRVVARILYTTQTYNIHAGEVWEYNRLLGTGTVCAGPMPTATSVAKSLPFIVRNSDPDPTLQNVRVPDFTEGFISMKHWSYENCYIDFGALLPTGTVLLYTLKPFNTQIWIRIQIYATGPPGIKSNFVGNKNLHYKNLDTNPFLDQNNNWDPDTKRLGSATLGSNGLKG